LDKSEGSHGIDKTEGKNLRMRSRKARRDAENSGT